MWHERKKSVNNSAAQKKRREKRKKLRLKIIQVHPSKKTHTYTLFVTTFDGEFFVSIGKKAVQTFSTWIICSAILIVNSWQPPLPFSCLTTTVVILFGPNIDCIRGKVYLAYDGERESRWNINFLLTSNIYCPEGCYLTNVYLEWQHE